MFTLPQILHARALYFHAKPRCERGKEGDTSSVVDKGAAEATARSPKPSDKLSLGAVKCRRRDRPLRRRLDPPVIYRDEEVSSASPPSIRRRRRRDEAMCGSVPLLTAMIVEGEGGREDTLLKAERAR